METVSGNIGQRLNELLFRLDLNQSQFAESVGVSSTAISKIINNKSKPGYELTESILAKYPQVNRNWFMAGKGGMYLGEESKTVENSAAATPELWQDLKTQMEARIKELEIFKFLYCQEKGIPNFLDVSEVPPVPFVKKRMQVISNVEIPVFLSIG